MRFAGTSLCCRTRRRAGLGLLDAAVGAPGQAQPARGNRAASDREPSLPSRGPRSTVDLMAPSRRPSRMRLSSRSFSRMAEMRTPWLSVTWRRRGASGTAFSSAPAAAAVASSVRGCISCACCADTARSMGSDSMLGGSSSAPATAPASETPRCMGSGRARLCTRLMLRTKVVWQLKTATSLFRWLQTGPPLMPCPWSVMVTFRWCCRDRSR
mmetsp:Transcript_39520/g.123626  ORF Transcript_39520/g.123626 Transcript_39520/m.123626 type:complete len:212 (-) Transcript_39520:1228-1863(-)